MKINIFLFTYFRYSFNGWKIQFLRDCKFIYLNDTRRTSIIYTYINVTQHSRKIWYAHKTRYCRVSFSFFLHVLSKLCEEQRDAINNAVREKKNEIFVRSLNLNVIVGCNRDIHLQRQICFRAFLIMFVCFTCRIIIFFNKLKKKNSKTNWNSMINSITTIWHSY